MLPPPRGPAATGGMVTTGCPVGLGGRNDVVGPPSGARIDDGNLGAFIDAGPGTRMDGLAATPPGRSDASRCHAGAELAAISLIGGDAFSTLRSTWLRYAASSRS